MSLAPGIAVQVRSDKQRGLFAARPVRQGEILMTYDGPIIDHATRFSIQIDDYLHIEGTPASNAYLNHSCAPNSYVDWTGVFLRALRDIEAGEELTCNYLTTDWELHDRFVCTCGAPNCHGEIKGFRHLSPEQQGALAPFLPEFLRRRAAAIGSGPKEGTHTTMKTEPSEQSITYRGVVYPWHCDHMGHMNVMWYVGKFDEATWNLFASIGITPSYVRERKHGMAAVQQNIAYQKELTAGDVITVRSRILEVRGKVIRCQHDLINEEDGSVAAVCQLTGVHLDLRTRRSRPLPPDIVARARARVRT